MNSDVDAGATNAELLPFGAYGPARFRGFTILSGTSTANNFGSNTTAAFAGAFITANASIAMSKATADYFIATGDAIPFTGSFVFPRIPLRVSTRQGNISNPKEAYFGIDCTKANSTRFDKSYADMVRILPESLADDPDSNGSQDYQFVFSLDDIGPVSSSIAVWSSGSRVAGTSYTAQTGTYTAVLTAGFDKFTIPLFGGFDGVDITEKEPFNNRVLSGQSQLSSYEFN